jgi:sulfite reductase (NADPH) flavoprotein alpha-component
MREAGGELWSWIADGAHIYVCGDAQRMAKDVETALLDIIVAHGGREPGEAVKVLNELKTGGRYQTDVY